MALDSNPGEQPQQDPRRNWAGNHIYQARALHAPQQPEQIALLVRQSRQLRAVGTRHSFNSIADAEQGEQISLHHLREITLNPAQNLVTVGAGVTYAELARAITPQGYALQNLASLPHIAVAGAVQTGTHGSGLGLGNLATSVVGLEMLHADGSQAWYRRQSHPDSFDGMVVALGALGIVTRLELAVVPVYMVRQTVYEQLPFSTLTDRMREVMTRGYSVSLFTHWHDRTVSQLWVKEQTMPDGEPMPEEFFGARAAHQARHPLPGHEAGNCTPQRGLPGEWFERLPHFRSGFTPSSGEELQSEYFVPFAKADAAIASVAALGDQIAPLLFVSELRAIAADSLWLSPCYERESLALHFTWRPQRPAVQALLPKIELALAPFHARPHWGKLFTMEVAHVRSLYPRLPEFQALAAQMDARHTFRNAFVQQYLFD